jgi:SAM-dependent MidA family methyltransferase
VEFGDIETVVIDPGVIFSNELLDALPAHRVTVSEGVLKEFFVDVDADGRFKWILNSPSSPKLQEYLDLCEITLKGGQIAEMSLEAEAWLNKVASSLRRGFVVTVDYGARAGELYSSSPGDPRYLGTLRGFRKHAIVDDVLADPGSHDLTTTVNWTLVEHLGRRHGLEVVDLKRQDKFLLDEGLLTQLEVETQNANSESERLRLSTAAREMILPDSMASRFQVLVQRKVD